ncbi:hypothetical protein L596_018694 [Steinernema carpocapsae]|uniref:Uncharacterized protein n=1 Tax=Steinernema carpocapsae TaxID=34508 RepID=A0A4U5N653_STECR|nr:hypothetical protein L596_018694 [Steinernema carpocapsae]
MFFLPIGVNSSFPLLPKLAKVESKAAAVEKVLPGAKKTSTTKAAVCQVVIASIKLRLIASLREPLQQIAAAFQKNVNSGQNRKIEYLQDIPQRCNSSISLTTYLSSLSGTERCCYKS